MLHGWHFQVHLQKNMSNIMSNMKSTKPSISKLAGRGLLLFKTNEKGLKIRQPLDFCRLAAESNGDAIQESPISGPGLTGRWVGYILGR